MTVMHDLLSLSAMLLAGVVGALVVGPLGNAARVAVERVRIDPRDR